MDDLVGDSEGTRDIFEQLGGGARDLTDAYLAATLAITGVAVAAYTIQASLRLRGEGGEGTLEPVLAAAVGRQRWLGSHVAVAVTGTLVLLALTGASIGLAYGLAAGDTAAELARFTGAALGQAPAALVLGGLTVAAFGLLPATSPPSPGAPSPSVSSSASSASSSTCRTRSDLSPLHPPPGRPRRRRHARADPRPDRGRGRARRSEPGRFAVATSASSSP